VGAGATTLRPVRVRGRDLARLAEPAALACLMAAAFALRAGALSERLWMDEAISVGIASHPLAEIPGVLRLDGSPPLYYVLLHAWMAVAGRSEVAIHLLSAALAVLSVPAAWWAGTTVAGRRAGWAAAVLATCSPFVTHYAGDARMYTLVVSLGFVCVACFVAAYVHGRRGPAAGFGVVLALLLYTHNWALFLGVAFAVAFAALAAFGSRDARRRRLRDGALGFGLAALLYLPWLPTLWFQARHTGAPWATAPRLGDLARAPAVLLGGRVATLVLALAGGAALVAAARARAARRRRPPVTAVLALLATVPVLLGWGLSHVSPAWTMRYLAIVLPPTVLLAALAMARARRAGLVALAVVAGVWATAGSSTPAGDVVTIARDARPLVRTGDLVVSAAPGQVPLLAYYLPGDLRFASPFGRTRDPGVMDWRDAVGHLERTSFAAQVRPLLDRTRAGGHVILVAPDARDPATRATPYARLVQRRAGEEEAALLGDGRFTLVAAFPREHERGAEAFTALVFRRRAQRAGPPSRGPTCARANRVVHGAIGGPDRCRRGS
jgi:mannosyltransferase